MSTRQKDDKTEGQGPDRMSAEQLQQAGGTDYAYLDQTRDLHVPLGGQGDGIPSSVLNPTMYPKNVKPEALHTEAEKAGADFPGGPTPDQVEDRSRTSEQIQQEYESDRPYLKDQSAPAPAQGRRDVPPANMPSLPEENADKQ